jgi:hypothetical protein
VFVFKDKLKDPNNLSNKVGRDRGKCRITALGVRCHALIHLNGRIGGIGHIRVKGDIEHGDDRLHVYGGTRQFNGVAGYVDFHVTKHRRIDRFDLVR